MTAMPRLITAFALLIALPSLALAQDKQRVNVYQYAIDHPTADVSTHAPPTLGASVPASVQVTTVNDDSVYGYFYYQGQPVIVDMTTRAVVRVGG
jgi:hypothetical protein